MENCKSCLALSVSISIRLELQVEFKRQDDKSIDTTAIQAPAMHNKDPE